MNHLKIKHYANILLVAPDGAPLNTISEKRLRYYLRNNLAEEVSLPNLPQYSFIAKLKFEPKKRGDSSFDTQVLKNKCVVCGTTTNLNLHHVVPRLIRSSFPNKEKSYQHGWCVLLCKEHHRQADDKALELFEGELSTFLKEKKTKPNRKTQEKIRALIALQTISNDGYKVPIERIKHLFSLAEINYTDNKDLKAYDEIKNFINKKEVKISRPILKSWALEMINKLGGVEKIKDEFRAAFMKLSPKYLAEGFLQNKK